MCWAFVNTSTVGHQTRAPGRGLPSTNRFSCSSGARGPPGGNAKPGGLTWEETERFSRLLHPGPEPELPLRKPPLGRREGLAGKGHFTSSATLCLPSWGPSCRSGSQTDRIPRWVTEESFKKGQFTTLSRGSGDPQRVVQDLVLATGVGITCRPREGGCHLNLERVAVWRGDAAFGRGPQPTCSEVAGYKHPTSTSRVSPQSRTQVEPEGRPTSRSRAEVQGRGWIRGRAQARPSRLEEQECRYTRDGEDRDRRERQRGRSDTEGWM